MPINTRTASQTSDQNSSYEIALKAYKDEEKKNASMREKLQTESNRLSTLMKVLQQHQTKLKASNDNRRDPTSSNKWFGAPLPTEDSVHALCQMLNKDLEATELFSGCSIEQCKVDLFPESEDEIKRRYEATGKVENIEFDIQLESVFQVLTGEERVSRVIDVVFRPPLPELQPLLLCLQKTASPYLLPRALRTLQDLERDQSHVRSWAVQQHGIEIASDVRFSLVLSYVSPHGQPSPRKDARAKLTAIKREKDLSSNSEASTTRGSPKKNLSLPSEDDMTIKLSWDIAFSDELKNFQSSFELVVSDAVLIRYSQSGALPFLAQNKRISSASDVIAIFSTFNH